MKKIFGALVFLLVLAVLWGQFKTPILERAAPCENPIPYRLGAFDARFGVSKNYFLGALAEAEAIWEKPFGRELFVYEPENKQSGALQANLIYDWRQEATDKLKSLGLTVGENKASYDALEAKFTELRDKFELLESDYNTQLRVFEDRRKVYEKEVEYWNARGGAPTTEYNRLQSESIDLQKEASELEAKRLKLNEMADEINAMVVVLNRIARALNLSIEKYNTIGASRGESFEEGVYSSDGSKKEINIYEFDGRTKLIRVLAHELGHALDLKHVSDPKAIMYELNQGTNQTLSASDLAAFQARCPEEGK